MIKKIVTMSMVMMMVVTTGCATTYNYNGQKYNTKEEMYSAMDSHVASILAGITPLNTPLTQQKLIFAIPSATTFTTLDASNFVTSQGSQPTEYQREVWLNLNRGNVKMIKVFYDAIKKRNIYASSQFVEMDSANGGLFAASPDTDVLFLISGAAANSTQWYYTSHKYGKQIFAYDRSSPNAEGKVQAFIDAVQAQAIRE